MNEILQIPDIAETLRISVVTVRRLIKKGIIPHRRIGKRIIMLQEDIDTYLTNSIVHMKEIPNENT